MTYLHRGRVAVQGAKDELLESYGRLACARSDLQGVDPARWLGPGQASSAARPWCGTAVPSGGSIRRSRWTR